ncbi:MAG: hypothetical protein NC099_05815 [Corallococcus sp.]|nr:hypothetical protein [Corallococcus sp.]
MKKKKVVISIISALTTIIVGVGITVGIILTKHNHKLEHHTPIQATCTSQGNIEYWTCAECNKLYSDENANTEIFEVSIPALGHNTVSHSAKAATCTEIGWNAYDTCSRCDYTTYSEIAALGHNTVSHSAKAATCTEIGWNAYDTCSRCDYTTKIETAALGHRVNSIEQEQVMIQNYKVTNDTVYPFDINASVISSSNKKDGSSATYTVTALRAFTLQLQYKVSSESNYDFLIIKHNSTQKAKESGTKDWTTLNINMAIGDTVTFTYSKDGSQSKNDDCGYIKLFTSAEQAELHAVEKLVTVTPENIITFNSTCTEDFCCEICSSVLINKLGHDTISHEGKAATCTMKGWNAYDTCSRCEYTTYSETAALGHDIVSHNAQSATCTEKGWNAYVTCLRCDYTTFSETSALGHTYNGGYCVRCNLAKTFDIKLYVENKLWKAYTVSYGDKLAIPTLENKDFYGWRGNNKTYYTDLTGVVLCDLYDGIVLNAVFCPLGYIPITDVDDLLNMSMDGYYALCTDINLSGLEWTPIGSQDAPFTGKFEGQGFSINNCQILKAPDGCIGLFGYNKGEIRNLVVNNIIINIDCSSGYPSSFANYSGISFGGITALNLGSISNVQIKGSLEVVYNGGNNSKGGIFFVGGLVGFNKSDIVNCSANCNITINATKKITKSGRTAFVTTNIGGLCGYNSGNIETCWAEGNVNSTAEASATASYQQGLGGSSVENYIGGLVGRNSGIIKNSYAIGNATGSSNVTDSVGPYSESYVGGLVGLCADTSEITFCFATGEATAIAISYERSGARSGVSRTYAGGLIGESKGIIANCYASGQVNSTATTESVSGYNTPSAYSYGGGLIGQDYSGKIKNCHASGTIIAASSATSSTANDAYTYAGGLVGYESWGWIENCYALGGVKATANTSSTATTDTICWAGGLLGTIYNSVSSDGGKISNSFATGSVESTSITNSSATSSTLYSRAGGVVGSNNSGDTHGVVNCYKSSSQTIKAIKGSSLGVIDTFGTSTALNTIKTASFYINSLEWNSSDWNFTQGEYPILNNMPSQV